MKNAPIVLFAYNRPWHTEQTLNSLANNYEANESELIIYVDGPKPNATADQIKRIEEVKKLAKNQTWCKKLTVHTADTNQGLAKSIIKGVTDTLNHYDRLIVIEDDMILSPYFLTFMNEGLAKYENVQEVISIHGYCVPINYPEPVFFLRGADCWGWSTWRRGWQLFNPDAAQLMQELQNKKLQYRFDFEGCYEYTQMLQYQIEGKIDSWAIRWHASAYLKNKLTLYTSKSLVRNIGGDGSGTHTKDNLLASANLNTHKVNILNIPLKESEEAYQLIRQFHLNQLGFKGRLKKYLVRDLLRK